MPSPFPGMDPYLEGSLWSSVHTQLGVEIQRQLVPLLRPRYIALTNERFVIATADYEQEGDVRNSDIYPDVSVAGGVHGVTGSAMGAAVAAPFQAATVMPEALSQISVEIRDAAERRLVTDIEILSPTNKRSDGRAEYLIRRDRLLLSPVHLMEIDLLRAGKRVPMPTAMPQRPWFVFLSRAERRPLTEIWPIALDMPLPVVQVPLLAGDADVPLNLQQAFSNVYDFAGYDLAVDYSQAPEIPLVGADAAWAETRVRKTAK